MSRFLLNLKKSLVCFVALATSASMLAPASAFAAETKTEAEAQTEVSIDNHTKGRENARPVSGIAIGDVTAPREGMLLDDKASVTTAEGETWEIPVIWIGEDLKPDAGLAGKGSYLPVLAYVVPDEYTIRSSDVSGRGYKITLSEDLLKLFGEEKIISIYENKTGITYILPAKLKDLYAQKGRVKNPTDSAGNEIVPDDQVASCSDCAEEQYAQEQAEQPAQEQTEEPDREPEEGPAQEQEEEPSQQQEEPEEEQEEESAREQEEPEEKQEETPEESEEEKGPEEQEEETTDEDETEEKYSHIVNVHCDDNAKIALTESDLEFLADLVVNTLQPQAVSLLIEKFPALKSAAENKKIGKYITVIVSYEEGTDTFGYARGGRLEDDKYGDYRFVYNLTVNAAELIDDREESDELVITRDPESEAMKTLANTVVHELFHCVSYDYNRPGLTGWINTGEGAKNENDKTRFPLWFIEGTASTVENNWQFRQEALKLLRTPVNGSPLEDYQKDLLVKRYVDGSYHINKNNQLECDYNFDIEFCNGTDRGGIACDTAASRYVSGYLACMYLYELAAVYDSDIGTSRSMRGEITVFNSEKLRLGMNSILERMHKGETLDQVINSISGGAYKDTAAFEALFIKGPKDPEDGKYSLSGDAASVGFVCDFMNYMNLIDKAKENGERSNYANGSVLFDFEKDFSTPLSFDGTYSASVLKPQDDKDGKFVPFSRSTAGDSYAYSTGGKSLSGTSITTSGSTGDKVLSFSTPAQENDSVQQAAKAASASDEGIFEAAAGLATEADADPAPEAAAEPEPEVEAEPELGAEPEPAAETEPELAAEPAPAAEPEPEVAAEPAPESAPEAGAESEAEAEPAATVEPEAEAESEADTESETEAVAGPEVEAKPETAAEPAPESAPEAAAEPEADAEPAAEAEPEADIESGEE